VAYGTYGGAFATAHAHAAQAAANAQAAHAAYGGTSYGGATYGAPRPAARVTPAAAAPAAPRPAGPRPPPGPALFDALVDAFRSERKLVEDLAATMRRQREAVAVDDLETVDDTVFATHRLLATLGQARIRRRQLNQLFAGADEVPVRALGDAAVALAASAERAGEVRAACDGLLAGASLLSREVDVNRRLLRDALAGGERHARALHGLGAAPAAAGDALLTRTA
jgi:hypothetical protein